MPAKVYAFDANDVDIEYLCRNLPVHPRQVVLQDALFGGLATREHLLAYEPKGDGEKHGILVLGGGSFQGVAALMPAYLDYAGLAVEFIADVSQGFDAVLAWAGPEGDAEAWGVLERGVEAVREATDRPILLVAPDAMPFPGRWLPGGKLGLSTHEGDETAIAKVLGCQAIPAILGKRIKAVMVDLDGTLYSALPPSEAHLAFQRRLAELATEGIKLCLVSWNEQEDVDWIFEPDSGFALKREDCTEVSASWDPKADTIGAMAVRLGLKPSEMVFIDDNVGHLAEAEKKLPGIRLVRAKHDAKETLEALEHCPGLLRI